MLTGPPARDGRKFNARTEKGNKRSSETVRRMREAQSILKNVSVQ